MPGEGPQRRSLLKEAELCVSGLPPGIDRIQHYETLADLVLRAGMGEGGDSLARSLLLRARSEITDTRSPETFDVQRRLIDLVYRFDKPLAESMAGTSNDDPARLRARLRVLRVKEEMKQQGAGASNETTQPAADHDGEAAMLAAHPQAAWEALAALNAGRLDGVHLDRLREYLRKAARLPLAESYPILAWTIQNAVERFKQSKQAVSVIRPLFEGAVRAATLTGSLARFSSVRVRSTYGDYRTGPVMLRPVEVEHEDADQKAATQFFRPGDVEQVRRYLRAWFEDHVNEYVLICDGYFGPSELTWLRVLNSVCLGCRVRILTSNQRQKQSDVPPPVDEAYRLRWQRISEQDPPETEVVVAGLATTNLSPIHDRWVITRGAGLDIGTSLSGLGNRETKITLLDAVEAANAERILLPYLDRRIRTDHEGIRIHYFSFML